MNMLSTSEENILALVTPIAESMQVGWDVDNYEQFSKYFTDTMKEAVNQENYEKQRERIFADLGKHSKLQLVATHKNPENYIVIWRLHCNKREIPALVTYNFIEDKNKVLISSATIQY